MRSEQSEWFLVCALICFMPFFVFLMRNTRHLRVQAESLGDNLLLKLPRPRVKRWETAWFVSACLLVVGQAAMFAYELTVSGPDRTRNLISSLAWLIAMSMGIGTFWVSGGRAYLEFREHGIVCGANFWPWENIREWSWHDGGSTLRLKLRIGIVWYRLEPADKPAVQAVLENHLMELGK